MNWVAHERFGSRSKQASGRKFRCQFWCQLGFAVRALKLMPKLQLLGYDRLFAILARGEL
jgi:hypothetical protein